MLVVPKTSLRFFVSAITTKCITDTINAFYVCLNMDQLKNKVKEYGTIIYSFIKRYFSITVVIYTIYNCYDYYITKPLFIIMLTITLMVHFYSIWRNNEISYSLKEKFKQFIPMIKNPLALILMSIIVYSIRFCIRYYFCVDFLDFFFMFLVIYISILPGKYLIYITMSTIKKGFKINLFYEGVIFSCIGFNELVTLCFIQYHIITLFKSKIPFVILFK